MESAFWRLNFSGVFAILKPQGGEGGFQGNSCWETSGEVSLVPNSTKYKEKNTIDSEI